MPEPKELQAGDDCPNCGGTMAPDKRFDPERYLEQKKRTRQSDTRFARLAEDVREKAAELGVIHSCTSPGCGYQARLKANGKPSRTADEPTRAADASRGSTDARTANADRAAELRRELAALEGGQRGEGGAPQPPA